MKILLRNAHRMYYAGPDNWIEERAGAADLRLIERAIQVNNEERLGATHIVLAYNSCNVTLPIANYNPIAHETSAVQREQRPATSKRTTPIAQ